MRKHAQNEYPTFVNDCRIVFHSDIREQEKLRHTFVGRRHNNPEYEVTMILTGACQADVGEQHFELRAGQGVVVPQGHYHIFRAEPGDFDRYSFRFRAEEGSLGMVVARRLTQAATIAVTQPMDRLCQLSYELARTENPYWDELFTALLKSLFLCVLAQLEPQPSGGKTSRKVVDRRLTIERYIEASLSGEPRLEDLARVMELSPRQLVRVLQENYGMTFRQKLLLARMDRAAWLLRTTELPADLILGEVGYNSHSAFYQVFRRTFGMTPLKYREKFRGSVTK